MSGWTSRGQPKFWPSKDKGRGHKRKAMEVVPLTQEQHADEVNHDVEEVSHVRENLTREGRTDQILGWRFTTHEIVQAARKENGGSNYDAVPKGRQKLKGASFGQQWSVGQESLRLLLYIVSLEDREDFVHGLDDIALDDAQDPRKGMWDLCSHVPGFGTWLHGRLEENGEAAGPEGRFSFDEWEREHNAQWCTLDDVRCRALYMEPFRNFLARVSLDVVSEVFVSVHQ